ncbi:MAG TPA: class I SAM-dependent methyltransferase [Fuerstia sp.]|nr:class I SAM-dependent methyltransferase [Fuerstiella sp.]
MIIRAKLGQFDHTGNTTHAMAREKRKSTIGKPTMADTADKFLCYQQSVQSPDHEIDIFDQAFHDVFERTPTSLREDFCGTFAVCCEWVKRGKKRTALGIDFCPETLQWGRDNNLSQLKSSQAGRIQLLEQDVRIHDEPTVDVLAAQNFSFWIFKTRKEVIEYFRVALSNLNDQGIMVMDMMGGGACYDETKTDKRTIRKGKNGFKYRWQQARFNPATADASFYIHFKFADGSKMKRAFEYHWRFWTIPEVREMLEEAGFSESHVYWELEDEDGEDSGEWERSEDPPSNPVWLCYIVGVK